jgi:hypothetical protein
MPLIETTSVCGPGQTGTVSMRVSPRKKPGGGKRTRIQEVGGGCWLGWCTAGGVMNEGKARVQRE